MSLFSQDAEIVGCLLQDRYLVGEVIGKGGFAVVYKGHDNNLTRDVAIKVPRKEIRERPGFRERFDEEKNRLVQVGRHSSIVSVTDAHVFEGIPYLVLDYMSGGSLRTALHRDRRQSVEEVSAWLYPIADALDFIHGQGVLHLDVKPGNILYDSENQAMLSDFGIARVLDVAGMQPGGTLPGSPNYMAPEAATGEVTPRYDQYSLGVIVFQALTGQRPERPSPGGPPIAPPDDLVTGLPAECSDAVMRAMAVEPEKRFTSCRDFAMAVSGAGIGGTPTFGASQSPASSFDVTRSDPAGAGIPSTIPPTPAGRSPAAAFPPTQAAGTPAEDAHAWAVAPGEEMTVGFGEPVGRPSTASAPTQARGDETQLPASSRRPAHKGISKNTWYVLASLTACVLIVVLAVLTSEDPGGGSDEATEVGGIPDPGEESGRETVGPLPVGPPPPPPRTAEKPDDEPAEPPPAGGWTVSGAGRTLTFTRPASQRATVEGGAVTFEGVLRGAKPGDILYVGDVRVVVDRDSGRFSQVVPFPSRGVQEVRVTIDNRGAVVLGQAVELDIR